MGKYMNNLFILIQNKITFYKLWIEVNIINKVYGI